MYFGTFVYYKGTLLQKKKAYETT